MSDRTEQLTHTNVSLQADREYVKAIKAEAYARGMTMGEFIRDALDRVHGEDIARRLAFFKANTDYKSKHSDRSGNSHGG